MAKTLDQNVAPAGSLRAAQYVRMSSDPQKYSIEIQAAAIAAYAARRNIEIVRTYSDPGRSGLRMAGREGLQSLIRDVQNGRADFDCILVFDISRWGRFQDTDESAYYEFICKRAGFPVHYCADEFENDGSLGSVALKNQLREKAAGFSHELSRRVFLGQSNIISRGFWRGGSAPYGFRRMLLDENGKRKGILQIGQSKYLKTDRIILVPGPQSEIRIVQRIFKSFVAQKKNRTRIAQELTADGILSRCGRPWNALTIGNLLRNEVYLGHLVYNRNSTKLGERTIKNPPEMWIRQDNAFKGIIKPGLFARAQKRLADVEHNKRETDEQMLDRLKALFRRKGKLTLDILRDSKTTRHPTVYMNRFGSLARAFELVGYKVPRRYRHGEATAAIDQVVRSVVDDIIIDLRGRGVNASLLHELYLLTISGGTTVAVAVARSVSDGGAKSRRWEVRKIKYKKADLTLLIRMDTGNSRIRDYFLMPTAILPLTKDRKKLRVSDKLFSHMRLESLEALKAALYERLHAARFDEEKPGNQAFEFIQQGKAKALHTSRATTRKSTQAQIGGRSKAKVGHVRR